MQCATQSFRCGQYLRGEGNISRTLKHDAKKKHNSRSQWPRVLRPRSTAARLLGLWVRITPAAWMSVCCEFCVLWSAAICQAKVSSELWDSSKYCSCDVVRRMSGYTDVTSPRLCGQCRISMGRHTHCNEWGDKFFLPMHAACLAHLFAITSVGVPSSPPSSEWPFAFSLRPKYKSLSPVRVYQTK